MLSPDLPDDYLEDTGEDERRHTRAMRDSRYAAAYHTGVRRQEADMDAWIAEHTADMKAGGA